MFDVRCLIYVQRTAGYFQTAARRLSAFREAYGGPIIPRCCGLYIAHDERLGARYRALGEFRFHRRDCISFSKIFPRVESDT